MYAPYDINVLLCSKPNRIYLKNPEQISHAEWKTFCRFAPHSPLILSEIFQQLKLLLPRIISFETTPKLSGRQAAWWHSRQQKQNGRHFTMCLRFLRLWIYHIMYIYIILHIYHANIYIFLCVSVFLFPDCYMCSINKFMREWVKILQIGVGNRNTLVVQLPSQLINNNKGSYFVTIC